MKLASLIAGSLFAFNCYAEIGHITEISGSAQIKRGRDVIVASLNFQIEQNDRVETKNGKLVITFKDNTIVKITEHSALVIDDFVYDPKSKSGKLNLKAAEGTVRYVSGVIAHNNPRAVNIKTPSATIAVRGTDFVMSVNEAGNSTVILMPSCEDNLASGISCTSGKIEVTSGTQTTTLDRPYQATFVESDGIPPSIPVTVNLNNSSINNNLQISPPKTMSGISLIDLARSANTPIYTNKIIVQEFIEDQNKKNNEESKKKSNTEIKVSIIKNKEDPPDATAIEENPYVKKLWKDKSETIQIGWIYETLSENRKNYTNVVLPLDTRILITVSQDMITNSYVFGGGKPQGQIMINQISR